LTIFPNNAEGAPGPSPLGTGDGTPMEIRPMRGPRGDSPDAPLPRIPPCTRIITLPRLRTVEEPARIVQKRPRLKASGMSPVQNVRYLPGPYRRRDPLPPRATPKILPNSIAINNLQNCQACKPRNGSLKTCKTRSFSHSGAESAQAPGRRPHHTPWAPRLPRRRGPGTGRMNLSDKR
jgi:hypothetical protein